MTSRVAWFVIVGLLAAMAIAAPVKIASKHLGGGRTAAATSSYVAHPVVHMAGLKFDPPTLVVKKGTAVLFDNNDVAPHTVTGDSAGGIDSGVISPSKSFSAVVQQRLVYHCAIHLFMKATIDVAG